MKCFSNSLWFYISFWSFLTPWYSCVSAATSHPGWCSFPGLYMTGSMLWFRVNMVFIIVLGHYNDTRSYISMLVRVGPFTSCRIRICFMCLMALLDAIVFDILPVLSSPLSLDLHHSYELYNAFVMLITLVGPRPSVSSQSYIKRFLLFRILEVIGPHHVECCWYVISRAPMCFAFSI